jgi:nicotinate-nucleotide--dimethylbenzimidazole phosphoribosyltransferase
MMDWLGIRQLLDLQMRLGEGTGAALAMSLVEASCKLLVEMASFGEAGVSQKEAR